MATRHIRHVTHRSHNNTVWQIGLISFFISKYSQTCLPCHQLSDIPILKNVYVSVFGRLKTFINNLDL